MKLKGGPLNQVEWFIMTEKTGNRMLMQVGNSTIYQRTDWLEKVVRSGGVSRSFSPIC